MPSQAPRGGSHQPQATYADLERVPEHLVAELIGGELFTSPRPATPDAFATTNLATSVNGHFSGRPCSGHPGGWWIVFEPELHFGRDVLVPDVAGWRITTLPDFPAAPHLTLRPDWVCEVLSPSTSRLDRFKKMPVYAREGVGHVWLVDPLEHIVEVFALTAGGAWMLAGQFGDTPTARIPPFEEAALDLDGWWLTPPAPLPDDA